MRKRQHGNALVEFTLVGIPLVFVLITTFEMARGMWVYHTLAYAIKEGTRYAIVHGNNCVNDPHNCAITVADVAGRIRNAGVGLDPAELDVTFTSATRQISGKLQGHLADTGTYWPTFAKGVIPTDVGGAPGLNLTITATYPFRSALVMFWPGAGAGRVIGTITLPASSTERIQF